MLFTKTESVSYNIQQITPEKLALMEKLLSVFGEAFDEVETYDRHRPTQDYLRDLLGSGSFIALAALESDEVVGGLAAYELRKFEQQRSEFYIYDLAVAEAHRRKGIATTLIRKLKEIARDRGAHVIFVQADFGDEPAISLYSSLGVREEVLHFDIPVDSDHDPS